MYHIHVSTLYVYLRVYYIHIQSHTYVHRQTKTQLNNEIDSARLKDT